MTYVEDIRIRGEALSGSEITLQGWVYNYRTAGKKLIFLQLRDGTGIIQCVISQAEVTAAAWEAAGTLTQETSLTITGKVSKDARSPLGWELHTKDLRIVGKSVDYPITPKEHGDAFLMD